MKITKGDEIRTKYQEWHTVVDVWDDVITTDKGYVHVSNVVETRTASRVETEKA